MSGAKIWATGLPLGCHNRRAVRRSSARLGPLSTGSGSSTAGSSSASASGPADVGDGQRGVGLGQQVLEVVLERVLGLRGHDPGAPQLVRDEQQRQHAEGDEEPAEAAEDAGQEHGSGDVRRGDATARSGADRRWMSVAVASVPAAASPDVCPRAPADPGGRATGGYARWRHETSRRCSPYPQGIRPSRCRGVVALLGSLPGAGRHRPHGGSRRGRAAAGPERCRQDDRPAAVCRAVAGRVGSGHRARPRPGR